MHPIIIRNINLFVVLTCEQESCEASDNLHVTGTSGFLASVITLNIGCGSPRCPWIIETQPGQMVNITLMNYNGTRAANYDHMQHSGKTATDVCRDNSSAD